MAVMLGADIGGTKIAVGQVDRDGRLRGDLLRFPSATGGQDALVESIIAALEQGREGAGATEVAGIGLACAGTVDRVRGSIVVSPNLPLVDAPLVELVGGALGLPVVLDNDANLAALAEARVGAAAGRRQVIMLTLGTGVGGGLILDGRLYHGATGAAGELGHMVVRAGGEPCRCGSRGCLEAYASGRALERLARNLAHEGAPGSRALAELAVRDELDGEAVGRLAQQGDPGALAAVEEVGRWLGVGLGSLVNIFNPEMIVVGGGLGTLGELVLGPARPVMIQTGLSPNKDAVRVVPAALGNKAGALGAGLLAWEELGGC